ncbi:MAG: FecR domain-containing protein [Verrucomicrobiota bacterium]
MNRKKGEDAFDPAEWIVKKDRGLAADEEAVYREAIEGDSNLAREDAAYQETWDILNRFPEELAAEIEERHATKPLWRRAYWHVGGIAAVLAVGFLLFFSLSSGGAGDSSNIAAGDAPITHRLSDGSVIRLNANSSIEVAFSGALREVRQTSGEVHFSVAKDSNRPFVVRANGFMVKAVGTAFNVRLDATSLEVLVTEGLVELDSKSERLIESRGASESDVVAGDSVSTRQLSAGQRALAIRGAASGYANLEVSEVAAEMIESALSWQSELRMLGGETLASISADFERKTGRRLIILDSNLGAKRIGGRFPSDNPTAFLQVLENNYGIPWRELPNGDFVVGEPE